MKERGLSAFDSVLRFSEGNKTKIARMLMLNTEFTAEERDVLREVLEHQINELDVEADRTDTHDFKQKVRHRRDVLKQVLAKINAVPAGT